MPDAKTFSTFKALLAHVFGSQARLASRLGIPYAEAALWYRTGRIPEAYWDAVAAAARADGLKGINRTLLRRLPSADGADTVAAIIALWPSQIALAHDLAVSVTTVNSWALRGSIPVAWWSGIIRSAQRHGIRDLSVARLHTIAVSHTSEPHGGRDQMRVVASVKTRRDAMQETETV
jgi:hypothetical protein